MSQQTQNLPALPEVGRPESYYAKMVHRAEKSGDRNAREAFKVAQYVTLACDPNLGWESKQRYFVHALTRHCVPPPLPDDAVASFYQQLEELVRHYAGREALRLASLEDDLYVVRLKMGQTKETIEQDAEFFFMRLIGTGIERLPWFNEDDWRQLRMIRDQWI